MSGQGPPPSENRRRRAEPARGNWKTPEGIGWQHGPIPEPPDGLTAEAVEAWATWFGAWYAGFWEPHDLPGLRVMVKLHDAVIRGKLERAGESRMWQNHYGVTPSGQQSRRWRQPEGPTDPKPKGGKYGHLRPVGVGGVDS